MDETFVLPRLTWISVLDILIVAFIIYQILVLIKGTRAVQMAFGISILIAFFYFSRWSRLETVSWLLTNILPYFVFAVIVIFQSEIRRALAHFGKATIFSGFTGINRSEFYDEMALAVTTLSSKRTGALIIVQRDIGLRSYIESGIALDAVMSYDLLVTIFSPDVPLHDGAVIIQNRRISAAACFLPLTVKPRLSKELGTRHRAAIGVTEETDAVAVWFRRRRARFRWLTTVRLSAFSTAIPLKKGCAMCWKEMLRRPKRAALPPLPKRDFSRAVSCSG